MAGSSAVSGDGNLSGFSLHTMNAAVFNQENGIHPPFTFTSVQADALPYDNDTIIVRFDNEKGLDADAFSKMADTVHAAMGTSVKEDFTPLGLFGMQVVQLPPGMDVGVALAQYNANPAVQYAEPNYKYYLARVPDDWEFPRLYGLRNTGQVFRDGFSPGIPGSDVDAPEAWDISTGGPGAVVAVLDTGVDYTHPDLSRNIWVNTGEIPANGIDDEHNGYIDDTKGWDFGDNDNDPLDDSADAGHGTHCAGTIGGVGNNGVGVTGVAWNTSIMPLKFANSGGTLYTSSAVKAIAYAKKNKANIISCSFGSSYFSQALKEAIDQAPTCLIVAAAGNDNSDNDIRPQYPASYNCPNILSVAATDENDDLCSFSPLWGSNYGPTSVDVAAPGSNIFSTVPYITNSLFYDDFSSLGRWNANTPWGLTSSAYSSPPSSVTDSPYGMYQNNEYSMLIMKNPVNCQSFSNLFAEFKIKMNMEEGKDYLFFFFSPDGVNIRYKPLTGSTMGKFIDTGQIQIPLDGTEKQIYFGFILLSDSSGQQDGAYIDDFSISTRDYSSHGYDYKSGTSMACPHVSGLAALVKSVRPEFSPVQVKEAILDNVDQKGSLKGKILTGGRINAYKTLKAIQLAIPVPGASFTVTPDPGTVGKAVMFTDTSSGSPDQWEWDFGDGNNSSEQNPTHTYLSALNYSVRLRAHNTAGWSGYAMKEFEVREEAPGSPVLSVKPGNLTIPSGSVGTADLIIDRVPEGLAGYSITLSLGNPGIAEFTGVAFPGWAMLNNCSATPADVITIRAADTGGKVNPGDRNVTLATISIRGDAAGNSNISFGAERIDDDRGGIITPVVRDGSLAVISGVLPFPGQANAPRDITGGGLYEDINGNGRLDFNDVVLYFTYVEWIPANEPVASFDYNRNGRIDFNDVVLLFDKVGSVLGVEDKQTGRTSRPVFSVGNSTMNIEGGEIAKGGTASLPITLDAAPVGIAGGTVQVRVEDTSVAEITAVLPPPWAGLSDVQPGEAGAFRLAVADTAGSVRSGATGVPFGAVTVRAKGPGRTRVLLEGISLDDDDGNPFPAGVAAGVVTVTGGEGPLRAGFTADTTTGPAPLTVRFTDTSTGAPSKWFWTFGDGGASQQRNPEHVYTRPGTYPVSLKVSNGRESYRRSGAGFIVVEGEE